MAKLNLIRKLSPADSDRQSYRMTLSIISSEDITKNVFVKQRIRNFIKNNFEDAFVAIATPTQLEDFDVGSPATNTSFYLIDTIDVVSRNLGYLDDLFNIVLGELQKLVDEYESLNRLSPDGIYTITADNITVDMADLHKHYRIPLVAAPCGLNEVYDGEGGQYQRVDAQNINLPGWLNNPEEGSDYKFKYNVAKDTALKALLPIAADKLTYAHLEVNGITASSSEVRILSNAIYWKDNRLGYAPFPEDYQDEENPGTTLTLVLDLIV